MVGLLAKMTVDWMLNSTLADAREVFINVFVDFVEQYYSTGSGTDFTSSKLNKVSHVASQFLVSDSIFSGHTVDWVL